MTTPKKRGRKPRAIKKIENDRDKLMECPPEFVREIMERAKTSHNLCVEVREPRKAAIVLWRLAQGVTTYQIMQETGMMRKTIRELAIRNRDTLETKKEYFASVYARAASEYSELLFARADQLHDNPDQLAAISPDKLALTVAIMTDKSAGLSGMATSVIEHRQGASIDDAAQMIAAAKARVADKIKQQAIEAEIVQ